VERKSDKSPWLWVPTLYFVEGLPYFVVNTISVVMFKDLGMSNGTLAMLTSLISLPWLLKPLWSPLVDLTRSKRWWILSMQFAMALTVALLALSLPSGSPFTITLILFAVAAFASATHDISADGFYMIALDANRQSAFVGIRNTFYRIAMIFGQGVLVVLAGVMEKRCGDVALSWRLTLALTSALLALLSVLHCFSLPKVEGRGTETGTLTDFGQTFASFFCKKGVWIAIAFMLLYRLPEALSVKMLYPFFSDPLEGGGLSFDKQAYGLVYGTAGVAALLTGGILGGVHIARKGLRNCFPLMAASLALPCAVYLYLALAQPSSLWVAGACVVFDQFGYGYGFTAYTVFMMRFAEGPLKTSHYALCTGFMALSMLLPGMVAGYLQEALGYVGFFILVMICTIATFAVTFFARRRFSF